MAMVIYFRSVWYDIFTREILDPGRPIPGCASVFLQRCLALVLSKGEESRSRRREEETTDDGLYDLHSS